MKKIPLIGLLLLAISCAGLEPPSGLKTPEISDMSFEVDRFDLKLHCRVDGGDFSSSGFTIEFDDKTVDVPCAIKDREMEAVYSDLRPGLRLSVGAYVSNGRQTVRSRKLSVSVGYDYVYLPDLNFKKAVLALYDADSDGELDSSEALAIESLQLNTGEIISAEGVRQMKNLHTLVLSGREVAEFGKRGKLRSLNVAGLSKLAILDCSVNDVSELDVSGCTALKKLVCNINSLKHLDLSDQKELQVLNIGSNYYLETPDLSGITTLVDYRAGGVSGGSVPDLSGNAGLVYISISDKGGAVYLDDENFFQQWKGLMRIAAGSYPLKTINLQGMWNLRSISLSASSSIEFLDLSDSPDIASVDINACYNLKTLVLNAQCRDKVGIYGVDPEIIYK